MLTRGTIIAIIFGINDAATITPSTPRIGVRLSSTNSLTVYSTSSNAPNPSDAAVVMPKKSRSPTVKSDTICHAC